MTRRLVCLAWLAGGVGTATCTPGPVTPDSVAGCYVMLAVEQRAGDPVDFLFPGFLQLDTVHLGERRQVRLPRDDLARRAGSWRWVLAQDTALVTATARGQGWRLAIHSAGDRWSGELLGWVAGDTMRWAVSGRRPACPDGMVEAGP